MLSNHPQGWGVPGPAALTRRAIGRGLCLALIASSAVPPAVAALNTYSRLDAIGAWVLERKLGDGGEIQCRAFIPSGGTWFGSNVRLNQEGALVVPANLTYSGTATELKQVQAAQRRCQSDLIYQP